MAYKEVAFVLFVCSCFLGWASATYCTSKNDCGYSESCCSDNVCRESCDFCLYSSQCGPGECCTSSGSCTTPCSDGVCRDNCYYCSYSSQCGPGECCDSGLCKLHCSMTAGVIAGIIISCLVVAAIVVLFVAYFYCERCPFYRGHLRPRQFMQGAQPMGMTTTVATQQNIQHPPPAGYNPPNAGCNPPPASGYSQFKD